MVVLLVAVEKYGQFKRVHLFMWPAGLVSPPALFYATGPLVEIDFL